MKPDISICISGIRTENWQEMYESIQRAIKEYTFEVIFVGPKYLPEYFVDIKNVKYCRDFGNPSRGLQIASCLSEGLLITWVCDDAIFLDNNLSLAIDQMLLHDENSKTIMSLIYTEGNDWKEGKDERITNPHKWFRLKYHDDLKHLDGIEETWFTAIIYLTYRQDYEKLGGLDCRFEGINFNIHDMCCRAQRDGYKIIFSDTEHPIQRIDWQPIGEDRTVSTCPILEAFIYNDRPLLNHLYSNKQNVEHRNISIKLDNWKDTEAVWLRKWK